MYNTHFNVPDCSGATTHSSHVLHVFIVHAFFICSSFVWFLYTYIRRVRVLYNWKTGWNLYTHGNPYTLVSELPVNIVGTVYISL